MIYEALLAPHERPVTLREIKRALLTYDKVVLIDPDDRDIMPSNAFMAVVMGMPLLGFDIGPVRPMYKVVGYDDDFSKTIGACRAAEEQGLLEVQSSYVKQDPGFATIGSVQTGGYPLNLGFVFWLYRSIASDQAFLSSAVANDAQLALDLPDEAAEAPCRGDGAINDVAELPPIEGLSGDEESSAKLTQVARGRLGAFVKYAGYCEAKNLVPVLPSEVYGSIAAHFLTNARNVFGATEVEPFWGKRNRVLELCHEEFMIDRRLDELSVLDVLKLRTRAWGKQAEAREKLFEGIFLLTEEAGERPDFEQRAQGLIRNYRVASDELIRERGNLALEIKCDLGIAALSGGVAFAGLMSQLQSPAASVGLTLAAGGIWALDKTKAYVPALKQLQATEKEMKRGAGFALHDFYSRLPKKG